MAAKIRRDDEVIVLAGKDKVSAVKCFQLLLSLVEYLSKAST